MSPGRTTLPGYDEGSDHFFEAFGLIGQLASGGGDIAGFAGSLLGDVIDLGDCSADQVNTGSLLGAGVGNFVDNTADPGYGAQNFAQCFAAAIDRFRATTGGRDRFGDEALDLSC